uniref:SMP-30/Gluconolactonase/LRE-like region domain-containing protein n=1 Tax=Chromera velia CCMP2878 TaxID=1169474 RepID=A0A0G4GEX5_9ALVE|eukprot:Cvel_21586.t1-p1 / transcript=Cvel_21586.t1 / gene=Cvel_21586 / organism=Chromera_velia_CCMP2878 / gene_product=Gluconolactonase, putative / transcript_product=Gluconolactonase, putative / location=Cvel_scaffold2038:3489-7007(+) / protein_length=502 / sequence_SO=supercontig / SO=protein_coding / is_pseudo=false
MSFLSRQDVGGTSSVSLPSLALSWGLLLLAPLAASAGLPSCQPPCAVPFEGRETLFENIITGAPEEIVKGQVELKWPEGPLWLSWPKDVPILSEEVALAAGLFPPSSSEAGGGTETANVSALFFTDTMTDKIYIYEPGDGKVSVFLENAGSVGPRPDAPSATPLEPGPRLEPGANGLGINPKMPGSLFICQHGARRLVRLRLGDVGVTGEVKGEVQKIASRFRGFLLNSPNDLAFHPVDNSLFFTDPPYGLNPKNPYEPKEGGDKIPTADERMEMQSDVGFSGLFRRSGRGLELLDGGLPRPNGVAFVPPEGQWMLVGDSTADRPEDPEVQEEIEKGTEGEKEERVLTNWWVYRVEKKGEEYTVRGHPKALLSEEELRHVKGRGRCDGLSIASDGRTVFATGPGGVYVLEVGEGAGDTNESDGENAGESPLAGRILGRLNVGGATSNCAIGGDGFLYVTAETGVWRVPLAEGLAAPAWFKWANFDEISGQKQQETNQKHDEL